MAHGPVFALTLVTALTGLSQPAAAQEPRPKKARRISELAAQSQAPAPGQAQTAAPALTLAWGDQAQHPMRALVDAAPVLTRELVNAVKLASLFSPKFDTLLNHPAFAKYAPAYRVATDEFARKRVAAQIQEELAAAKAQLRASKYWKYTVETTLSEYVFRNSTFPFRTTPGSPFSNDLVVVTEQPHWRVLPTALSVPEAQAEAFVRRQPKRTVTLVVLVASSDLQIPSSASKLQDPIQAKAVFTGAFANEPDGGRTLLALHPSVATLPGQFKDSAERILAECQAQSAPVPVGMEPMPGPDCNPGNGFSPADRWIEALKQADAFGFGLSTDPALKALQTRLERTLEARYKAVEALFKAGQPFKGVQTYPNGVRKPFTLIFARKNKDFDKWEGKATYANGQKAIVHGGAGWCPHGPCVLLTFWHLHDDEVGAGDGTVFHLVNGHQAVGMALTDKVTYGIEAPVRISFK